MRSEIPVRAFVAIDLPASLHAALGQAQAAFRSSCRDCRWTRPEGIHLTLKFLGQVSEAQVAEITRALAALGPFEKFSVQVKGFGLFPDTRRPRVFWAGLDAPPALPELAKRVEGSMERLGFAREARPFVPHLTLGRFKIPRRRPALEALLEQDDEASLDVGLGGFEVSEFFLFESKLSPQGAEYRKVARFPEFAAKLEER